MSEFLLEVVQVAIIAGLWVLVARDVRRIKLRTGRTPGGVSALAWGALVGITWVAALPYVVARKRAMEADKPAAQVRERNLSTLLLLLTVAAIVWSAADAWRGDYRTAAEHGSLAVVAGITAIMAFRRDRADGRGVHSTVPAK